MSDGYLTKLEAEIATVDAVRAQVRTAFPRLSAAEVNELTEKYFQRAHEALRKDQQCAAPIMAQFYEIWARESLQQLARAAETGVRS